MTKREMLQLAALAAGIELEWREGSQCFYYDDSETGREIWMPDMCERQAFILADCLWLIVDHKNNRAIEADRFYKGHRDWTDSENAQEAITKCAAEIGRGLKERKG